MENLLSPLGKNSSLQKLCDIKTPYLKSKELDLLFFDAMKEIILWHQKHSSFYKKLIEMNAFNIEKIKSIEDLTAIPEVWAHFFKTHELLSVDRKEILLHLTSSGTQGQKSQVFFDNWSIHSAQRMVDWIFEHYGWVDTKNKTNYLLYSYETEASSKLGTAYTDNFLCKYAPVNKVAYALKLNGHGGHEFDIFGCIRTLQEYENEGKPVRIFGFPAFLYFTCLRMKELGLKPLKLHPQSLLFSGGGWKSHNQQQIAKSEFYSLIEEYLGIPNERLRDGYGSTEHCIPYIECKNHQFHVPIWSRVFIRDFKTLRPLPYGQSGFLHFVSPYITSMPAHAVTMGDKARLYPGSKCECGIETDYFILEGRAGLSTNKSCAVTASELLKSIASSRGTP